MRPYTTTGIRGIMGTRAVLCLALSAASVGVAHATAPLGALPAVVPVAIHQISTDPARMLDLITNRPSGIGDAVRALVRFPADVTAGTAPPELGDAMLPRGVDAGGAQPAFGRVVLP